MTRSNLPFAFFLFVFILAFSCGAGHRTKDTVQKLLADKDIHELGESSTPRSQQSQAAPAPAEDLEINGSLAGAAQPDSLLEHLEEKPGAAVPEQEGLEFEHALVEVSNTSQVSVSPFRTPKPQVVSVVPSPYAHAHAVSYGKPGNTRAQVVSVTPVRQNNTHIRNGAHATRTTHKTKTRTKTTARTTHTTGNAHGSHTSHTQTTSHSKHKAHTSIHTTTDGHGHGHGHRTATSPYTGSSPGHRDASSPYTAYGGTPNGHGRQRW